MRPEREDRCEKAVKEALALTIISEWNTKFGVGLIMITDQKNRCFDFYKGTRYFRGSKGIFLSSSDGPEYRIHDAVFYVRGNNANQDNNAIIIPNYDHFVSIIDTISEYNEAMREKKVDNLTLHKKVWTRIAENNQLIPNAHNPESLKQMIVREICKEERIEIPSHHCFLCQEATDSNDDKDCNRCKGFWGGEGRYCYYDAGYFKMWEDEQDADLRKALALRIACNVKVSESDMPELNDEEKAFVAKAEKIAAIKSYRNRTNCGLKLAKETVEAWMASNLRDDDF